MHFLSILAGVISSGVFGLYIGNFATNPIYRLPRNEPLFIKDPYCDSCNAKLVRRDLYPVLSWLLAHGKCRYCVASVPAAYLTTEILTGILFVVCYLLYGFSEMFLLVSLGMTSFIMLATMLVQANFFSNMTLVAAIVFGMLYRTLLEGTLYGFAVGAFAGILVGAAIWKLSAKPLVRDVKSFPPYMKLLVAAGVWLSLPQFTALLVAAAVALPLRKSREHLAELTIIACVILLTLIRTLH